jgi:hypothetical protein
MAATEVIYFHLGTQLGPNLVVAPQVLLNSHVIPSAGGFYNHFIFVTAGWLGQEADNEALAFSTAR